MGSCWKTIGLEVCCIPAPEQRQALLVTPCFWQHWRASGFFPHFLHFPYLYCPLNPFLLQFSLLYSFAYLPIGHLYFPVASLLFSVHVLDSIQHHKKINIVQDRLKHLYYFPLKCINIKNPEPAKELPEPENHFDRLFTSSSREK